MREARRLSKKLRTLRGKHASICCSHWKEPCRVSAGTSFHSRKKKISDFFSEVCNYTQYFIFLIIFSVLWEYNFIFSLTLEHVYSSSLSVYTKYIRSDMIFSEKIIYFFCISPVKKRFFSSDVFKVREKYFFSVLFKSHPPAEYRP